MAESPIPENGRHKGESPSILEVTRLRAFLISAGKSLSSKGQYERSQSTVGGWRYIEIRNYRSYRAKFAEPEGQGGLHFNSYKVSAEKACYLCI
jgi:hypothetical protein